MIPEIVLTNNWFDLAEESLGNVEPGRVWRQELNLMAVAGNGSKELLSMMEPGIVEQRPCDGHQRLGRSPH